MCGAPVVGQRRAEARQHLQKRQLTKGARMGDRPICVEAGQEHDEAVVAVRVPSLRPAR